LPNEENLSEAFNIWREVVELLQSFTQPLNGQINEETICETTERRRKPL